MEMERVVHTVTVVDTEKGFLVRPACVVAERSHIIRFVNLTHLPCQVLVPSFSFLGERGDMIDIAPGEENREPLPIPMDAGRGAFPYQIYVYSPPTVPTLAARRVFACGESAPHVIIE